MVSQVIYMAEKGSVAVVTVKFYNFLPTSTLLSLAVTIMYIYAYK